MAEQRRRITTLRQFELLLDFVEEHQDLALGPVRSKEARALAERAWCECADILNLEGPSRTTKEWAKVYNDMKFKVRAKLVAINQNATGGGPSSAPNLNPIEERVASLIKRDDGPLTNVRQEIFNVVEDSSAENIKMEQGAVGEPHSPVLPLEMIGLITTPPVSPVPSERRRHPSPRPLPSMRRRRILRNASARQPTAARPSAKSNRDASDELRQMALRIEEMRAEANLVQARAMESFSRSFDSIAQSIAAVCRKFCDNN